jgi:hypothetical protein
MELAKTPAFSAEKRSKFDFVVLGLLLVFGVQLWFLAGHGIWLTLRQFQFAAGAIVLMCVPPVHRRMAATFERVRHPSRRTRAFVAVVIAIVASAYLVFTAWRQGRPFEMSYHDEFMYRLQTTLMAHGRLWMPAHPLADFFDTFYVFTQPVYGPQSFPGTALLFAPSVWLHVPWWLFPVLAGGVIVGLVYWLTGELIDGLAGLIAALMTVSVSEFRRVALMNLSQVPSLFIGLWTLFCFVQWRRRPSWIWTLLIGVTAGWHAITRPLDAVCFALPVGIAMLVEMRRWPAKRIASCVALLAIGASPFVLLQVVFNLGVTGHWWQTPLAYYDQREQPGVGYGFRAFDPNASPPSPILQKKLLYEQWVRPSLRDHTLTQTLRTWPSERIPAILLSILPAAMLLVAAPAALRSSALKRAWIVVAPLLALVLYAVHPVFGMHYMFILIPAGAIVIILGIIAISYVSRWLGHALLLTLAAIAIGSLPEFDRRINDQLLYRYYDLEQIEKNLRTLPDRPAIVLFRFHPENNPSEEPVYNAETCWPDDARVIRAHDLGQRNRLLFMYYAQQPTDRSVYRYDRGDGSLKFLGTVRELAAQTDGGE